MYIYFTPCEGLCLSVCHSCSQVLFFFFVIVNVNVTIMQFSSEFGIYKMSENI